MKEVIIDHKLRDHNNAILRWSVDALESYAKQKPFEFRDSSIKSKYLENFMLASLIDFSPREDVFAERHIYANKGSIKSVEYAVHLAGMESTIEYKGFGSDMIIGLQNCGNPDVNAVKDSLTDLILDLIMINRESIHVKIESLRIKLKDVSKDPDVHVSVSSVNPKETTV